MNKKFSLGKGLGALIPDETHEDESYNLENNIKAPSFLSINLIKPNQDQPRKYFDEEKILLLSESIKEHGIIQPIIVKKQDDAYIIVAGERRWRAAKAAGLKDVPVIVMNLSDKQVLEISLIENIQRQDLNPIEEAWAFRKLIDEFSFTQEELSRRIGKSRTSLTNSMRLLNLDMRVQEYLIDGVISEGHGRALLAVTDNEMQYKTAQIIIDDSLSVRETEKLINSIKNKQEKTITKEHVISPYIIDIKSKLEERFSTKVLVSNKNNKGKIEIEYYSSEDLERILDILRV